MRRMHLIAIVTGQLFFFACGLASVHFRRIACWLATSKSERQPSVGARCYIRVIRSIRVIRFQIVTAGLIEEGVGASLPVVQLSADVKLWGCPPRPLRPLR